MSTILVVGEHLDGVLAKASLSAVQAGNEIAEVEDGEVVGLILGNGAQGIAEEFAKYVSKVVYVDSPLLANNLAEVVGPVVAAAAKDLDAEYVLTAATTTGKDFLPRTAVELDAGFISDIIAVYEDDDDVEIRFKRPIWAGNLIEHVATEADINCITVRGTNFDAAPADKGGSVDTKALAVNASEISEFVSFEQVKSDRPALTDADVVVSGGRGLKSAEAFEIITDLADQLGAAVGASRAAVDSGYAPNDWQVGQTGKIVAPNLYIAVAIPGAIQHLAGMKGSKVIVAINKDPEAPIFQRADFGLVADAFEAVPELTKALSAR